RAPRPASRHHSPMASSTGAPRMPHQKLGAASSRGRKKARTAMIVVSAPARWRTGWAKSAASAQKGRPTVARRSGAYRTGWQGRGGKFAGQEEGQDRDDRGQRSREVEDRLGEDRGEREEVDADDREDERGDHLGVAGAEGEEAEHGGCDDLRPDHDDVDREGSRARGDRTRFGPAADGQDDARHRQGQAGGRESAEDDAEDGSIGRGLLRPS